MKMKCIRAGLLLLVLCLSVVATVGQTTSSGAQELLRTAYSLYRAGKFDEAYTSCTKAIALNPKDYRAHVLLGYIYGAQRKLKNASDSFATAISLEPKDKEVYLLKAQVDFLRNASDQALVAARKAIELDPKYSDAHMMVGALLKFDPKRRNEAIAAYENALQINPQLVKAYEELGQIYEADKQEKKAEEIFRKGMDVDPKHMAGRFALGRMLVKQNRLKEARELWDGRTSDEDNTFPNFIELLTRAENFKRATDAAVQNPNDPQALVNLGIAIMEGDHWVVDGRQERAIKQFRRALELKPDYAQAQYQIVKAYIQLASTFAAQNKNVDAELVKLRQMDAKLADEMVAYRKEYKSGLIGTPVQ